jgi:ABC-type Fe3+/spermidine/putrescine transport system ATPase subunit
MSGDVPLQVRSLTRRFGSFALQQISLEVRSGEYVAIAGPCGAGKTLLLETVAGFHEHPPGTILLRNLDASGSPPERRGLGLMCQGDTLFPHLSVEENIRFGLRYLDRRSRTIADRLVADLIPLLGLESLVLRMDIGGLSGGERRLVTLARALAPRPRLLLLDEPVHSLDISFQRRVLDIIGRIPRETGVPVLHVTHDIADVAEAADRVVALDQGRVVQAGELAVLRRTPKTRFVAELVSAENLFEIPAGSQCLELGGCRIEVQPAPPGSGVVLAVLDPERIRVLPGEDDGAGGRVVGLREQEHGIEVLLSVGDQQLTVRTGRDRMDVAALRLAASVTVEVPVDAVHLLREQAP